MGHTKPHTKDEYQWKILGSKNGHTKAETRDPCLTFSVFCRFQTRVCITGSRYGLDLLCEFPSVNQVDGVPLVANTHAAARTPEPGPYI